jgi:GTP diphosphokinase / guanosine-3',5'-bis(diphosphate) 3'-diphosphatase
LLISKLLKVYKQKTAIDFYAMIASEQLNMTEIKKVIGKLNKSEQNTVERISDVTPDKIIPSIAGKQEDILEIDEKILNNVDYKLSKCCSPIFGDDIFGFVTINDGIKIHRVLCPNARDMIERYGYRVVKARWAGIDSKTNYLAAIKLTGEDEIGVLSKVSDLIAKDLRVNMRSMNIDTGEGRFEGVIRLFVREAVHLDAVIHKLMKVKGVISAVRVEGG